MKMNDTIEFIKEYAPKLAEALYGLDEIKFEEFEDNNFQDVSGNSFKALEKELTKVFGSEYPKMMLVSSNNKTWVKQKVINYVEGAKRPYIIVNESNCVSDWMYAKEIPAITKEKVLEALKEKGITDINQVKDILND